MSALVGLAAGSWNVLGAATFVGVLLGVMTLAVRAWRTQEAKRRDYFTSHLEHDTKAMLDPKPRVRVEDTHLRVGVDFGVPAAELTEADDQTGEAKKRAVR